MKISTQHDTAGLSGSLRSVQTGETIHFQFGRRATELPFEVVLGDKRLEVFLRIEHVETDPGDDIDVELSLRAPDVATPASVDFVPKVVPPGAGGKIDTDGAAMEAPAVSDAVVIAETAPIEVREVVLSESERAAYPEPTSTLALQTAETAEADLFEGEEQVGSTEEAKEGAHPATVVPELPGVGAGAGRKAKGRR